MLARRREGGEQAAEGMRGPDAEHQVEGVWGGELRGIGLVEDESPLDAGELRGLAGVGQRALGDVHSFGP